MKKRIQTDQLKPRRIHNLSPMLERGLKAGLAVVVFASAAFAQRADIAAADNTQVVSTLHGLDLETTMDGVSQPLGRCGDALSAALQQNAPGVPCWSNVRTVDHWNSSSLPAGLAMSGNNSFVVPHDGPSSFHYTLGGMSAFSFPDGNEGKVYGAQGAASGLIERRRWQMMLEDGGALGDLQLGGASFAGLNRAAARATGEVNTRWSWQGSATNTFGTDALRTVAPLDYRIIGQTEAPAADTVSYGLHRGNALDQEEGAKIRYADSPRTRWDLSAAHVYRHYSDDGFGVQTARARLEYLHSLTRETAFGIYGDGANQTSPLACSLGGGGARLLSEWGPRASINVSGGINGASAACGKSVQFTGDAALYLRANDHNDLYFSADRGLGDGAIEKTTFLDTASVGVRHAFNRNASLSLSGVGLYGTSPVTRQSYHGSFAEINLHYPIGLGFSQESAIRHYSVSGLPAQEVRTAAVFTLWWSPKHSHEVTLARAFRP